MNPWVQRVEQSQALAEVNELSQLLVTVRSHEHPPEDQDYLARIELAGSLVASRLRATNPMLLTESILNSLATNLSNARSYLTTWDTNNDEAYLRVNAQGSVDNILGVLGQLIQEDLNASQAAVAAFRNSVSGYRLAAERGIKRLGESVEAAQAAFDEKSKSASLQVDGLASRIATVQADVDKTDKTIKDLAVQQQTAFTTAETERSETFRKLLATKQDELEKALKQISDDASSSSTAMRNRIEEDVQASSEAKARIEQILGLVGEEALVGQYSVTANRDRSTANSWRWITVCAIVGAILGAAWLAHSASTATTNWHEIIAKVLVTLSFSSLAGYAGRQSAEHRRAQRRSEKVALQLAALKPYLSDIDDKDIRDGLLKEIAAKLFDGNDTLHDAEPQLKLGKDDDPTLAGQLLVILQEVLKATKH